jgi:hypothetical protein
MGLGHEMRLDEVGGTHDLAETLAEIDILRHRLNKTTQGQATVTDELRRLTAENNELKLYMATAFRLLLDKQIVTRDELQTVVSAIDGEDGVEDGRYRGPVMAT